MYIGGFNSRRIEVFNIFQHASFLNNCQRILRKASKEFKQDVFNRDALSEEIRSAMMYYFWSKCEWEITVDHWPPNERFQSLKISVYDQVRMNWDPFIDYIWAHREEMCRQ